MSKEILTQNEIDDLLKTMISDESNSLRNVDSNYGSKKIRTYDFKRPEFFSKSDIHEFLCCANAWIERTNFKIQKKYGGKFSVKISVAEQKLYEDYIREIPIYSSHIISEVDIEDYNGLIDFEIEPIFAMYYLENIKKEKLASKKDFELTSRQEKLLYKFQMELLKNLSSGFKSKNIKLKFHNSEFQQNSRHEPIINWNCMVLKFLLNIEFSIDGNKTNSAHCNLVIPADLLQGVKRKINAEEKKLIEDEKNIVEVYETPEPLEMTLKELRSLKKGTVLNFATNKKTIRKR